LNGGKVIIRVAEGFRAINDATDSVRAVKTRNLVSDLVRDMVRVAIVAYAAVSLTLYGLGVMGVGVPFEPRTRM